MATVYKKISAETVRSKQTPSVSSEDNSKVSSIIGNFVNLFKQKHLS